MLILLASGDRLERERVKSILQKEFPPVGFVEVPTGEDLETALSWGGFDLAVVEAGFLDDRRWDGTRQKDTRPGAAPFVVLADDAQYRSAKESAIFVPKDNFPRLYEAVRTGLAMARLQRERDYLLQAIGQPAYLVDPAFRIIKANREALEATAFKGDDLEAILGCPCYKVFHGLENPPENCLLRRAAAIRGHVVTEMRLASGRVYRVSCTPVTGGDGRMISFIHVAFDVTYEKLTTASLRQIRTVLDLTTEGVVVADEGRLVQWVNKAFTRLTGYTLEEVKGKPPFFLDAGWNSQESLQRMDRAVLSRGY